MATLIANKYLDELTTTAGEAMTINNGAHLTCRTDYRVKSGAPASNLGSLASVTINEGKFIWDSSLTRWMAFTNSGSAVVPAIGTIISQGGVSGYLLGIWASKTTAQTAVGAAIPVSGFMKFREVTGGAFAAGAVTGIANISASSADVQGWLSLPHDAAANFTIPRLGEHRARGGRFFLEDTSGVRGQNFQIPTEGSTAMFAPGLMIETGVGTNLYEFWPALNGASNGWAHVHVGNATGTTDIRQSFLKAVAGGVMTMGETWSAAATYASLAAQASTYATLAYSCTYTWVNNVVECYQSTGHQLENGQQTGLDFTSGGATAYDAIYTVTVLDAFRFTVPLTGSGTAGAVTSRPGVSVAFTAHTLNIGDSVYCDFTSGTGVDGTYEVYIVSANAYTIKYPHIAALTAGNVSTLHTLIITSTTHGLAVGQTIYCDFTTGGATLDGVYVARVVAANTISITYPHSAAITSSNVTISRDVGYVCSSGRRTWIPSNILNEVATGARATNTAPNGTILSRPEWVTTSAGAIDLEYVYGCSGYISLSQPYSVRIRNSIFFDRNVISECATPLDIDGLHVGMHGALDIISTYFANCYAGGTVKNVKSYRGNTPAGSGHSFKSVYCNNILFENIETGIIQYARSTGYFQVTTCNGLTLRNCRSINTPLIFTNSPNCTVEDLDRSERLSGHGLAAQASIALDAGCHNFKLDGLTFGCNGTVPNQVNIYCLYSIGCNNLKVRNIGSRSAQIPLPTWAKNLTALSYIYQSGGSNNGVKIQRCYLEGIRTAGPFTTSNSDKNMFYESCFAGYYNWETKALFYLDHGDLNGTIKNCMEINAVTGIASVYGTHFVDMFTGDKYGRYLLIANEPTTETTSQFSTVTGIPKWNSSGGILIEFVGDQHIWTDPDFRKGHTGFVKSEPVMTGGVITNYNIAYQIDLGSGFSAWKNLYYNASNVATVVNASATTTQGIARLRTTGSNHVAISAYADATTFLKVRAILATDAAYACPEVTVNAVATSSISICRMTDTTAIVIFVTATFIRARLLTLTGSGTSTSVDFGAELTVNGVASSQLSICRLSDSKAIIAFRGSSNYLQSCVIEVSGTTLTNGSIISVNAVASTYVDISGLSDSAALVAYQGTSTYAQACVLSVSGNVVTANTVFSVNAAASLYCTVTALTATQAVLGFTAASNYPSLCALNISGTTITKGTTLVAENAAWTHLNVVKIDSTHVFMSGTVAAARTQGATFTVTGTDIALNSNKTTGYNSGSTIHKNDFLSSSRILTSHIGASSYVNTDVISLSGTSVYVSAGTSGSYTIEVKYPSGINIGDYCFGNAGFSTAGISMENAIIPKVTDVTGNVVTLDVANTANFTSNSVRFSHIPNETVTPATGFKLKQRITTFVDNATAITFLRVETKTTAAGQENLYPLDTFTFTLTGLIAGSDVTILAAGTETVLDNKEDISGTSSSYVYETPQAVDITVYKPGYIPYFQRNFSLAAADASFPVSLVQDASYLT